MKQITLMSACIEVQNIVENRRTLRKERERVREESDKYLYRNEFISHGFQIRPFLIAAFTRSASCSLACWSLDPSNLNSFRGSGSEARGSMYSRNPPGLLEAIKHSTSLTASDWQCERSSQSERSRGQTFVSSPGSQVRVLRHLSSTPHASTRRRERRRGTRRRY